MKKKWFLLAILFLMAGVFVSCKHKGIENKNIVIAVIPKADNEIFDQVKESANQAAKELGITLTWEAPTSNNAKKQKELIENLIHYKVDGILISCNDEETLKEPINEASKAGIKVATFDSDCPVSQRIFYVGTDNEKAGKIGGETMLKLFEKSGKKPNQILVLSGGANAVNMVQRLKGFRSAIDAEKICGVLYSFEMPDYGKDLLSFKLTGNNQINGVQTIWSVPILGGLDSVPALSRFMKKGGISVFFDVSKPLLRYVKDNPNCALLKQDFKSMGYNGVKNLYNAITGKAFEPEILYDVTVIDQSNAEEELKKL
ncbi:MAG: periplasmic binding protein/LacI transcriptional regulator [Bacteroidetes bacterium]|nr:periplasmic binding protein/LacI transcriptional regulator [Bacteroidota bacterium]